jgi:outer membrane immunogenic protein
VAEWQQTPLEKAAKKWHIDFKNEGERPMNKLILTGLAFTALAVGPAMAADMPVKAAAPIAPAFSWTGLYIGVNGGGAYSQKCSTYLPGATGVFAVVAAPVEEGCFFASGAFGGAQVGFNWQTGLWVIGVEATGDWGNLDGAANPVNGFTGDRNSVRVKSFATVTGRIGYTVSPTVLLYVGGGGAWARDEYSRFVGICCVVATETRSGWVGNAGAEWAFLPNLSVAVDYRYIALGRNNVTLTSNNPGFPGTELVAFSQNIQAITIKLNYKFWGAM